MSDLPGIYARGPWESAAVRTTWREDAYRATASQTAAADDAIAALRDRGSPSHDGLAARVSGHSLRDGKLELELQRSRWALRLVGEASSSLTALCIVRDADGRWLAGRRAAWLASWAGRWAMGAGGAVEVDEDPVETLARELEEEWSVTPATLSVEALLGLPSGMVMLVGQAWLAPGAEVERDHEHDAHAWWPADLAQWSADTDPALRRMAQMLDDDSVSPDAWT